MMLSQMRPILICMLIALTCLVGAHAQSTPRVAIVGSPATASAVDLLTTQLSSRDGWELLERTEINRVLSEQALAADIKDAGRLGRLLTADGLIFVDTVQRGTNMVISARLVAVKAGVVLAAVEGPWPLKESEQWAEVVQSRFDPLLPKLLVPTKDAVPISILNVRAAANSAQSQRAERELTVLLIHRLMRERELFVLERRRMDALTQEHELNSDQASAFWSGAFLLEGTIDKNGFAQDKIAVSVRFSPPGAGSPHDIEVTGPRRDLTVVVDDLAKRILKVLHKDSSAPEWKRADEAARYLEEARWALKWNLLLEAQSAAESAWALGRQDIECATVRTRSYVAQVAQDVCDYGEGEMSFGSGTHDSIAQSIKEVEEAHPGRVRFYHFPETKTGYRVVKYVVAQSTPDPVRIQQAQHALELYYNFSRTLATNDLSSDSPWILLGLDAIEAAAKVLQHFYFVPSARSGNVGDLEQLRAMTRSVADWVGTSASVRRAYFIGDKFVSHDQLYNTIEHGRNLYRLKSEWGCFLQETPEECVAMYRDLATSPAFPYLRQSLWIRKLQNPLVISWNLAEERQAAEKFNAFCRELIASTNLMHQIEGRFLVLREAQKESDVERAFNDVFEFILANTNAIARNTVGLVRDTYPMGELIGSKESEALNQRFYRQIVPRLKEINAAFEKLADAREASQKSEDLFARQKEFLQNNTAYDAIAFSRAFAGLYNYTPEQARELKPLLITYKSNLVAQSTNLPPAAKGRRQGGISRTGSLIDRLERTLNPQTAATHTAKAEITKPTNPGASQIPVTNVQIQLRPKDPAPRSPEALLVSRFYKLPDEDFDADTINGISVFAHRYREGRIWLDVRYDETSPQHGNNAYQALVAGLNPESGTWRFIEHPKRNMMDLAHTGFGQQAETSLHFEIFQNALYVSDRKQMLKFDFNRKKWETLNLPIEELGELFAVHDRLFFASSSSLIEVKDGGTSTHVLASTRRRPAQSALDHFETLGKPVVFAGPNKTIRAFINYQVYSWDGKDWIAGEKINANAAGVRNDATLFSKTASQLWLLPNDQTSAKLAINAPQQLGLPPSAAVTFQLARKNETQPPTLWDYDKMPWNLASTETVNGDIFVIAEHSGVTNVAGKWELAERDGRHAELICFFRGKRQPVSIPLKFELANGPFASAELDRKRNNFHIGSPYWVVSVEKHVIIGHSDIPGCWVIPRRDIDKALATDKSLREENESISAARFDERAKYLRETYDADHDGKLSPNEKEEMVADPKWFEANWPSIDRNANGYLDVEDDWLTLDANENGAVEDNELQAIDNGTTFIISGVFNEFDANGDRFLELPELQKVTEKEVANLKTRTLFFDYQRFRMFDLDKDSRLDPAEMHKTFQYLSRDPIYREGLAAAGLSHIFPTAEEVLRNDKFRRRLEKVWETRRKTR